MQVRLTKMNTEGGFIDKHLVCQQFEPLVKKYARMYIETVPDAEQEAWLILLQALHTFNPGKNVPLAGYLRSRVKYCMLNLWKKEIKRKRMEYHANDTLGYIMALGNPEAELEKKEATARMLAALQGLPQRQLLVLVYGFQCEYKPSYIAQLMGITVQAVSNLKIRALRRLKTRLKG